MERSVLVEYQRVDYITGRVHSCYDLPGSQQVLFSRNYTAVY